jgi:hypothetical protein
MYNFCKLLKHAKAAVTNALQGLQCSMECALDLPFVVRVAVRKPRWCDDRIRHEPVDILLHRQHITSVGVLHMCLSFVVDMV